jgi:hypothetical protein
MDCSRVARSISNKRFTNSQVTVASQLPYSLETILVTDFPFVLVQFTVLCVQFIGIPLLLLFVVIDEFLSRADSRASSLPQSRAAS